MFVLCAKRVVIDYASNVCWRTRAVGHQESQVGSEKARKVFRTGFSATGVELEMCIDVASVVELSARRHVDACVVSVDRFIQEWIVGCGWRG